MDREKQTDILRQGFDHTFLKSDSKFQRESEWIEVLPKSYVQNKLLNK